MNINWTTNDLLVPTNYGRLRDRLWGPNQRTAQGHSCMDGVKRELELVTCMLLDDQTVASDFGSTTIIGEHQIVEPLNAVMGKPYITKIFKPVCGIVNDPSTKVLMNRFSDTTGGSGPIDPGPQVAPFRQKKMYEDMFLRLAEIYRQFTGHQVDNFEQLLGMRRVHKWGQTTAPPESYANKETLLKRIVETVEINR